MNVAFDANIWISFSIGKHLGVLRHILLDEALQQTMQIHGCAEIVTEYRTVVGRPKLKKVRKTRARTGNARTHCPNHH